MNDDLLNQYFLEAFPNPERKGCPPGKTLQALAENTLPPGHPALRHVVSCSECYAEYRHYRLDWEEAHGGAAFVKQAPKKEPVSSVAVPSKQPSRHMSRWAIAAGVVVLLGGASFFAIEHRSVEPHPAELASNAAPVQVTVDLFDAVTTRGASDEPTPLQQVSLPSSKVVLAVTLPRFSESGPYQILVSKDRAAKDVVARGVGDAVESGEKVQLSANLDLSHAAPGTYFLATVRGSDNGTYYYPLKIQ